MCTKLDEFGTTSAHDIEAVRNRSNEIMQSAEVLLGSLRIEPVHQQLAILDHMIAHATAALGSRADDSDRRIGELCARLGSISASQRYSGMHGETEVRRETPGGFNFP